MSVENRLYRASFNGVEFLVDSHRMPFGRKKVIHEFVNSNVVYTEDLGLKNRSFLIKGIITGTGNDYFLKRDALINVLVSSESIGILVHPFIGILKVAALDHSLDESISKLNVATFRMTFQESQENQSPFQLTGTAAQIFNTATIATQQVTNDFNNIYFVSSDSPANYNDALTKVNQSASIIGYAAGTINLVTSTENYNNFNNSLNDFSESTNNYVLKTEDLSSNLKDLFIQMNNISDDPSVLFNAFENIFDYGDDDITINLNTVSNDQKQNNRESLNLIMQFIALVFCYQNASLIDYETINDIYSVSSILENQYLKVVGNPVIDSDAYSALNDLRNQVNDFFQQARKTAWRLTEIETQTIPITVLGYQYYGNIYEVNTLIDINQLADISFVAGKIDVLTQ